MNINKNKPLKQPKLRLNADKNTLLPSSCEIPKARAVFPVPGGPASNNARPAIFFWRIISTTRPAASLADA